MAMLETAFRYAKKVWDFVDNLVDEKNKEIAKYQAKYRDYSRDELIQRCQDSDCWAEKMAIGSIMKKNGWVPPKKDSAEGEKL